MDYLHWCLSCFLPLHYIGIAGFPRRYYSFTNFETGRIESFIDLNTFVSFAAILTFIAQFIFLFNFFYSMYRGRKASSNPWKSNNRVDYSIEPGHGNWPGKIPTVSRWPYDYSKPGAKDDFILTYSSSLRKNLICLKMNTGKYNVQFLGSSYKSLTKISLVLLIS